MNRKIEDSLKRSMEQMPHPSFQTIVDTPVVRMQEHDAITRQEKNVVHYQIRSLALACACFLMVIGVGWFVQFGMIYSIVNVDVNPSLEIMVNRRDKVLSVKDNNQAAKEFLEGRNYKGWDIREMMESLMDDLALQGYLTDEKNIILLSVDSRNQNVSNGLQTALPTAVSEALADYGIIPKLFIQQLNKSKEMQNQAEQYHISQGRQQFINLILRQDSSLTEEKLVSMNLADLISLAEKLEISFDEIEVWYEGEDDSKSEIKESQPRVEATKDETEKAAEITPSPLPEPSNGQENTQVRQHEDDDDDDDGIDNDDRDNSSSDRRNLKRERDDSEDKRDDSDGEYVELETDQDDLDDGNDDSDDEWNDSDDEQKAFESSGNDSDRDIDDSDDDRDDSSDNQYDSDDDDSDDDDDDDE